MKVITLISISLIKYKFWKLFISPYYLVIMPIEVWCKENYFTIPSFKLTVWKSCWGGKVLILEERNIDLWKGDWERLLSIIDNIFSTVLLACNIGALGTFCVDVFCMDILVHMLVVGEGLGVSFQIVIMKNYVFL